MLEAMRTLSSFGFPKISMFVTSTLVMVACVGTDPSANGGSGGDDGGGDGGVATNEAGSDGSVAGEGGSISCACVDSGASLSCTGAAKSVCGYGCADATADVSAHCRVFDPTGAVDPTDLTVGGLKDYTGKNLKFFTDTGQITTTDGATEIRAANKDPLKEEVNADGIGFRRVDGKLGIFQFKNLTVEKADGFNFNGAIGSLALALVATEQITISGELFLGCTTYASFSAYPSAGSSPGGRSLNNTVSSDGSGLGKGMGGGLAGGVVVGGGGGGGHGVAGGRGGDGFNTAAGSGGQAGAAYADPGFDPPLGGSGGGSGGSGVGGAGGGAIQIVAGTKITIGSGAGPAAGFFGLAEGINVGGCGGSAVTIGPTGGAGGGGSGGTILLEAPVVVGMVNAGIASNGGAGAETSSDALSNGTISTTPATSVPSNGCFGGGGKGGAGTAPSGETGITMSCAGGAKGGGGGGSVGFIRILTASGDLTADPSFVISPTSAPQLQKGKIATR